MQAIFNTCFNDCYQDLPGRGSYNLDVVTPQPMKFRFIKSLNLLDPILKKFALPHRKQKYTFPRKNLYYIETQNNHIPFVYASVPNPSQSVLLVYCHGSGSTLNHVYEYCNSLAWKFNIATVAYDYTGDGESNKQFKDFQSDLRCILAWAVKQGYDLRRIILCGFSLGSYSALCLKGQMSRILISPIVGLTSYVEDRPVRYEGQMFDNIGKALQIKSRVWITHCTKQLIPIQHSLMLKDALLKNNKIQAIEFTQVTSGYDHKSAPGFLCTYFLNKIVSQQGSKKLEIFIGKVQKQAKQSSLTQETKDLKSQLLQLAKLLTLKTTLDGGSINQTRQ